MPTNNKILPLAVIAFVASLGTASAATITVVNPSFETLPAAGLPFGCGAGCFWSVDAIPGWTNSGESGQFQPGPASGTTTYFNSVPDGLTVAYSNGGTISQIVADVAQAGVTYTLAVDVGFRKETLDPGGIALMIGSNTSIPVLFPPQFTGDWVTFSTSYTTTAADAGAAITILLTTDSSQGDWDNVRLTSELVSVPEPASLLLLSAGLIGLGLTRRRS